MESIVESKWRTRCLDNKRTIIKNAQTLPISNRDLVWTLIILVDRHVLQIICNVICGARIRIPHVIIGWIVTCNHGKKLRRGFNLEMNSPFCGSSSMPRDQFYYISDNIGNVTKAVDDWIVKTERKNLVETWWKGLDHDEIERFIPCCRNILSLIPCLNCQNVY